MSETKRATLSTINTQKSDVKKVKGTSRTIRFRLTLPESNEKACPEYNYRDLLNSAEKKKKSKDRIPGHPNGLNNLDPFDDNDDDVKRIAKQFEEKYGITKKRRRGKKDDYADIGAGYDESDSFIDNTDAYDEMVPENVTTLHGGFYINSGALEFKQFELSGSESSDSEASVKSVNRKRILEDSEDSDTDEEKDDNKVEHIEKKRKLETNGIQKPVKKKLVVNEEKDGALKKKKIEESPQKKKVVTVKDLLREKREEFDMTLEPEETEKTEKSEKDIKPSASSTIIDVIESVVNANIEETSKDSSASDYIVAGSLMSSESESSRDALPSASQTEQPQVESLRVEPEQPIVKLPEPLPANVLEVINAIKKAAKNSEGKVKFFSGPVNNMFLNLEINCRKLGKSFRLQIYEHLAPFVKCKKDTLMRRAKNLLLDQEKGKVEEPLKRLKAIVDNSMPVLMKNYEKECQKIRDEMFLANANANAENSDVNSKVRRIPRKKFPWADETRKILQEIIFIKKKCFTLEGIRKETFEEHLESFLKTSVVCLWPEGWISITTLMKQVKLIIEPLQKPRIPNPALPLSPITLDVHAAPVNTNATYVHSPVKNISLSPSHASTVSGITVIPIPQSSSLPSPKAAAVNGPKSKHNPPTTKPTDLTHSINKKPDSSASATALLINMSAEICAVPSAKDIPVSGTLLVPSSKPNVTIASVDLRTNHHPKSDNVKENECAPTSTTDQVKQPPKPASLKQRILSEMPEKSRSGDSEECQIIDLTESPTTVVRKPGPKSKTRYVEGAAKPKRVKESVDPSGFRPIIPNDEGQVHKKPDEITGTQALNQIITGLTKYGSNLTDVGPKVGFKENQATGINEDEMEQVIKDLQELQQLQEHARKNDIDIMAPAGSPVSVIAFNSSYSPSRLPTSELPAVKEQRKVTVDGTGFQDIFQKHLFQDVPLLKQSQPTSVYNSNVQPKNSYNSINNCSYSSSGSISNSMNNIRYTQSSSKYNAPMTHLQANPSGATNHTDEFALFQNFLYQYGFHNSSGPKQKSPP